MLRYQFSAQTMAETTVKTNAFLLASLLRIFVSRVAKSPSCPVSLVLHSAEVTQGKQNALSISPRSAYPALSVIDNTWAQVLPL